MTEWSKVEIKIRSNLPMTRLDMLRISVKNREYDGEILPQEWELIGCSNKAEYIQRCIDGIVDDRSTWITYLDYMNEYKRLDDIRISMYDEQHGEGSFQRHLSYVEQQYVYKKLEQ